MKTLISIKKDMEFNAGLSLLIDTLKSIAISQYYAMEKRLGTYKDFFLSIKPFIEAINVDKVKHFFTNSTGRAQAVVAITSDAGFLGGLNMKVVNTALKEVPKMPTTMIIVGGRGKMYIRRADFSTVGFPGIRDDQMYGQAMQLRDYICEKALAGKFGTVKVVYPRTVSLGVQHIETIPFLPFRPNAKRAGPNVVLDMILESKPEDIIEYLAYLWMGVKLYEIFGQSRLAEFSARYFHLEESGEKLKEEEKKVKLQYFRVRHELADRSIRELVAGRSVRGKK